LEPRVQGKQKKERKTKMKTTVRATVIIPDCYVTIQRLHDMGTSFRLEKEIKVGHDAADFIEKIKIVGNMIDCHEFIDDDDFKQKTSATFEYITD
jgi:ribosomal protein S19